MPCCVHKNETASVFCKETGLGRLWRHRMTGQEFFLRHALPLSASISWDIWYHRMIIGEYLRNISRIYLKYILILSPWIMCTMFFAWHQTSLRHAVSSRKPCTGRKFPVKTAPNLRIVVVCENCSSIASGLFHWPANELHKFNYRIGSTRL